MLDEGVGLCVIPKLDPKLVHVDEGPSELLELGVGTNPGHQEARGHDGGLETPGLVLGVEAHTYFVIQLFLDLLIKTKLNFTLFLIIAAPTNQRPSVIDNL